MKATRQIKTILGRIRFTASIAGDDTAGSRLSLEVFPYDPKLLKEHSVQRSRAILLRAKVANESQLEFECELDEPIKGQPASGQYLDAQEWIYNSSILAIGTDDAEMLEMRFPQLSLDSVAVYPVEYKQSGFKIKLENIPKNSSISLHYNIAEGTYIGPDDESANFAVDPQHNWILSSANSRFRRTMLWSSTISVMGFCGAFGILKLAFFQMEEVDIFFIKTWMSVSGLEVLITGTLASVLITKAIRQNWRRAFCTLYAIPAIVTGLYGLFAIYWLGICAWFLIFAKHDDIIILHNV